MKLLLAAGKQARRIAATAAAYDMHLSGAPSVPTNAHCCKRKMYCRTLMVQLSQMFFGATSRGCVGNSSGLERMAAPTVLRSGLMANPYAILWKLLTSVDATVCAASIADGSSPFGTWTRSPLLSAS